MKAFNKPQGSRSLFTQFLLIFWPPVFVFSLHVFLVRVVHIYDFFPWLDIPMHYLGGLSMAYSIFLAQASLQDQRVIRRLDKIVELVLNFTVVVTIAVFWEFAEFLSDHYLGTDLQISLPNTMQDLLMGILGSATLVGYKAIKSSGQDFVLTRD